MACPENLLVLVSLVKVRYEAKSTFNTLQNVSTYIVMNFYIIIILHSQYIRDMNDKEFTCHDCSR